MPPGWDGGTRGALLWRSAPRERQGACLTFGEGGAAARASLLRMCILPPGRASGLCCGTPAVSKTSCPEILTSDLMGPARPA